MHQPDKHEVVDLHETWPDPPLLPSVRNGLADVILKRARQPRLRTAGKVVDALE